MRMLRGALAVALAAAALAACGGSPTEPTPPTGPNNCPADKTYFYCSNAGYACSSNDDCCGSLTCDPATRACTDGVGGLRSGFRCSSQSLCLSEAYPNQKEQIASGVWGPVYCDTGICRWVEPSQGVYCSKVSQACNGDGDCCGSLWCDRVAGQCTDGRTPVAAGYRCSDQTSCVSSQSVGRRQTSVFCDTDGICKWPPYCAD